MEGTNTAIGAYPGADELAFPNSLGGSGFGCRSNNISLYRNDMESAR